MPLKKPGKRLPRVVSALTARTQLGQIMRRAKQKDERFIVDRRGEPQVVIMSMKDYISLVAPTPKWLREIQEDAKRKGLHKLTMREINAEITAARREQRQKEATEKQPAK
jgi:prevent-host-death family protein